MKTTPSKNSFLSCDYFIEIAINIIKTYPKQYQKPIDCLLVTPAVTKAFDFCYNLSNIHESQCYCKDPGISMVYPAHNHYILSMSFS